MKLILGDCVEKLKELEDNSVDAVITDPPYALGFMGKEWDTFDKTQFGQKGLEGENDLKVKKNFNVLPRYNAKESGFQEFCYKWSVECLRVLKPGGHLLAFGGTRTYHRMAVAIEDSGFEVRDMLEWIYASGFPKSQNIALAMDKKNGIIGNRGTAFRTAGAGDRKDIQGKNGRAGMAYKGNSKWEGFGSSLKPSHEPIILARCPLSEKTIVENVLKWGCGAIDIDGCRIPTNTHLTGSDLYDKLEIVLLNNKLCQLNLSNLFVENAGKKKFPEDTTRKIRSLFSAVGNVDMPTSEKILGKIAEDISKMDIGCSEEMLMESISTSLNTYISGKNTTEEKSQKDMMSTTLTENETTTEKKTSNSLQEANTSNSIGRFPANCICTDDALNDGVMTKTNSTGKNSPVDYKTKSVFGAGYKSGAEPYVGDSGSKSRYFDIDVWAEKHGLLQFPKASKRERNEGCEGLEEKRKCYMAKANGTGEPSMQTDNFTSFQKNHHPTVKPVHLMSWLVRLVSKEGDTVLDPFAGSFTTGVACEMLNRNFIGIEQNEEYCQIGRARIEHIKKNKDKQGALRV